MKRTYYQRKTTPAVPPKDDIEDDHSRAAKQLKSEGPSVTINLPPNQQQSFSIQLTINPVAGGNPVFAPALPPAPPASYSAAPAERKTLVPLQVEPVPGGSGAAVIATAKPTVSLREILQRSSTNNNNAAPQNDPAATAPRI